MLLIRALFISRNSTRSFTMTDGLVSSSERPSTLQATEDVVGVQCDPGVRRLSAFFSGHRIVPTAGTIIFAGLVLWQWDTLGQMAPWAFGVLLIVFCILALRDKISIGRVHVTRRTLTLEGINDAGFMRGGLEAMLVKMIRIGGIRFPDPDATYDPSTDKVIPFRPGQKERLTQDQREIEALISQATKMLTPTPTSPSTPPTVETSPKTRRRSS